MAVPYPRGFQEEEEFEEPMEVDPQLEAQEQEFAEIYAENPQYYRFLIYQYLDLVAEANEDQGYEEMDEMEYLLENEWEEGEEDWNDDWPVRFDLRRGFYTMDYDSGIDEPMSSEEYDEPMSSEEEYDSTTDDELW